MNRRTALKHISVAFGSAVATPTLLSILSSCTEDKAVTPLLFLNTNQALAVEQLVQFLLPESDFPGVENLNLLQFTDQMLYHTTSNKEQELFKLGYNAFNTVATDDTIKRSKLTEAYFTLNKTKETQLQELLKLDKDLVPEAQQQDYLIYHFLTKVRYYCLFGYCTSKAYKEHLLS